MELTVSAQKMDLTEALKNYVDEKFSRLNKFSDRSMIVDVHLSVEKYRNHIHAKVKAQNQLFNSEADDPASMYKAIDTCVDKLEKQFRRSKPDHHEKKAAKEEQKLSI